MKIFLDCIPCFMQQALRAGRMATDYNKKLKLIMDRVAGLVENLSMDATAPEIGKLVYRVVSDVTGNPDPYKSIKQQHIAETKAIYPELEQIVANSDDQLLTAIRIAIAGNVIDLGVTRSFDIVEDVRHILKQDFAVFDYDAFKSQLAKTERILYIGDNVGESVFDKILIKALKKPVVYAVRGIPVINDVTMEDAIASGLDEVADLMDSGCESPGVNLKQCTPAFLKLFNESDFIISKGQGNFEGLSDSDGRVFFLLKAKCHVISSHLGVAEGSIILKERNNGCDI